MNAYTMTWYRGTNYGSVLQAYALTRTITSLGYPCQNLAYFPTFRQRMRNMVINRSYRTQLQYKLQALRRKFSKQQAPAINATLARFNAFRQEHMHITPAVHTEKDILSLTGDDSVFICGSDQIWSPYLYNAFFFLHFVKDPARKIPYAPSFGVQNIPGFQKKRIQKRLRSFSTFSVREGRGAEFIQELTGKEAFVACDPTVLLTKEEWLQLTTPIPAPQKPYIFCYFLSYNEKYMRTARAAAAALGMELKVLPVLKEYENMEETITEPAGPAEWISWLNGAAFVLTDSFHCTLFSIRFGKDFYVFQRFAQGDKRGQNTRIENLLGKTSLTDRIIGWEEEVTDFLTISCEKHAVAEEALQEHATLSRAWLSDRLAEAQKSLQSK